MRDPLSRTFWPIDFFFLFLSHWVGLHWFFFFFFVGFGFLGTRKKKLHRDGCGPPNSVKNSEWWYQIILVFRVMSDKNWAIKKSEPNRPQDSEVAVLVITAVANAELTSIINCKSLSTSRCSIVVSIPACHAGDPGSIPGNGVFVFLFSFLSWLRIRPNYW